MRIGVSLRSGYSPMDGRVGTRWMVERARAARAADLDSLFVGDHHNVPVPYFQNTPMLGRLLAEWNDRPAGCLFLLPLWHPVLVAEQIGTLAAIAQGPFVMQCAIGGGAEQFAAMGASLKTRPSRFEAAIDVIRRLSAGETVNTETPWKIENARIAPTPPEPLEIWIGAAAPPAIDRAARLGDAYLVGPEATPEQASGLIDEYRAACARHGKAPTTIAIRRDVHIGADEKDAERVGGPVIARGYRGFDPKAPVVGSVGKAVEAFGELNAMGYTDVIVRHLADDQSEVLKSFERLAAVKAQLT